MKFQIIDKLEGRYAPALNGKYYLCKGRMFHTELGPQSLRNYGAGTLTVMLQKSIPESEVRQLTAERLMLLHEEQMMDKETEEAMEWFKKLAPKAQLAQIKYRYQDWYNDQDRILAEGEY